MEFLILVFFTSFIVVLLSTPALIKVAILKRLYDTPTEARKIHSGLIPSIGGIIIFAATIFSFSLWFPSEKIHDSIQLFNATNDYKYIVATVLVMFFVGVKDDIIGTAPVKKLIAHVLVGMVLALMADIRITSLHGIFGINSIPTWASIFITLFTYIVVVNSFNLIDGVDGLASGIGFIASSAFGSWFAFAGDYAMACLSFALAGSLAAFLIFNFSPAKIFMGDSGSLTIGLIMSVLAIKLINYDVSNIENVFVLNISKPVFTLAVLVYPLIDTLRIFIYRAVRGVSPFSADRNHIHHRLLGLNYSHKKTSIILYVINVLIILFTVSLTNLDANYILLIIGATVIVLTFIPFLLKKKNKIE